MTNFFPKPSTPIQTISQEFDTTLSHMSHIRKEVFEVGKTPNPKILSTALVRMKRQMTASDLAQKRLKEDFFV